MPTHSLHVYILHAFKYTHAHIHTWKHTYTHENTYTHINTHTHTYTHTRTHSLSLSQVAVHVAKAVAQKAYGELRCLWLWHHVAIKGYNGNQPPMKRANKGCNIDQSIKCTNKRHVNHLWWEETSMKSGNSYKEYDLWYPLVVWRVVFTGFLSFNCLCRQNVSPTVCTVSSFKCLCRQNVSPTVCTVFSFYFQLLVSSTRITYCVHSFFF